MALVPFPSRKPDDPEDWLADEEESSGEGKMSFLEHLDELRKRLIVSVAALAGGVAISFLFINQVFDFIMRPLQQMLPAGGHLIYTEPTEAFVLYMKIALLSGIVLAAPVIMWQVWLFIAPGLYAKEKRSPFRSSCSQRLASSAVRRSRTTAVQMDVAVLGELQQRLSDVHAKNRVGLLALHEAPARHGPGVPDARRRVRPRQDGGRNGPVPRCATSSTPS